MACSALSINASLPRAAASSASTGILSDSSRKSHPWLDRLNSFWSTHTHLSCPITLLPERPRYPPDGGGGGGRRYASSDKSLGLGAVASEDSKSSLAAEPPLARQALHSTALLPYWLRSFCHTLMLLLIRFPPERPTVDITPHKVRWLDRPLIALLLPLQTLL